MGEVWLQRNNQCNGGCCNYLYKYRRTKNCVFVVLSIFTFLVRFDADCVDHRIFHARKPFIIPKIFNFKSENSTLFSDIPGNILYQTKHYYSRIYGGIYGACKVQDPRHPYVTSDTNYSFSSSEQKEKEEKYSANVNLSFMSVEWVRKLTWKITNKYRIEWTQFSNVTSS